MSIYFKTFPLSLFCVGLIGPAVAQSDSVSTVKIVTAILAPDPQSGMKSTQTVTVDFKNQRVTSEYKTGTTEFFGVALSSVADNFKIKSYNFLPGQKVRLNIVGETASGVGVLPHIDYDFIIEVSADGTSKLSGCHDGYPAYTVHVNNTKKYDFKHKPMNLLNLFGSCDIKIP
jgi:hypothetical protein